MKFKRSYPLFGVALSLLLLGANINSGWSQSRRQPPTSNEKKNKRPGETPQKPGEPGQEPLPKDLEPAKPQDIEKVSISTQIVNVDAVVYHKKSGQIVTDLKKLNFAIFADGTQQEITNFSTPEAPITVAMVVEYSKWSEMFGLYGSRGYEPGTYEVIRPTAMFLSQFIKPPDDYVSVVAFDIRPTPLTDFTNDPGRLQQVVWNLVSNAVKFTPKQGRVQVRLERVNSHVEIVVSDTGIGIRPDFLPFVFERFRQAEGGTTRRTGGLGLGLAIVRHIVEMHGGIVEAASAGEGQGATFRVRLPLMILHPAATETKREHPRTERREALAGLADLQGVHVVAIDDEPDALTLLRVVLETAGAEVTTFNSPLTALEQVADVKPHVLVVDLGMPEMDGFELIRRIRQSTDPAVRNLPAAALTAFARSEDRTKALRSGFEMHLAKPVDPGELVASVATLARRVNT